MANYMQREQRMLQLRSTNVGTTHASGQANRNFSQNSQQKTASRRRRKRTTTNRSKKICLLKMPE